MRIFASVFLVLVLLLSMVSLSSAKACSCAGSASETPQPAQAIDTMNEVGPEGGVIDMGDLVLEIPEGAVTEPVQVEVIQKAGAGELSLMMIFSPVYEITADADFSRPVTLALSYEEGITGLEAIGIPEQSLAIFGNSGQGWEMIPSVVHASQNTVSAQLTHFSMYTVSQKQDRFQAQDFVGEGETFQGMEQTQHQGREAYRIMKTRRAKLLGLFDVDMEVESLVDAENEEVLEETGPWWSFLVFG